MPGYVSKYEYEGYNYYFLASARNAVRLSRYQRTDVRLNKSWMHDRWKFTLYAEVVNLTNHANYYFVGFGSYNSQTRQVPITTGKTFPTLPSAGMLLEW